ncbi:hypothetical protein TrRE_jg10290, partial [Triparma retinervis]
ARESKKWENRANVALGRIREMERASSEVSSKLEDSLRSCRQWKGRSRHLAGMVSRIRSEKEGVLAEIVEEKRRNIREREREFK